VISRAIILTMILLLLSGCQTLSERKQADDLLAVLRDYEAVIRWSSLEQARRFLLPEKAGDTVATTPRDLRVTHYEVVQGPAMLSDGYAVQTAVIQYVFEESQVVHELVDQQHWHYDPEAEHWYLVSPLPVFK
jgi:hypothetical protein